MFIIGDNIISSLGFTTKENYEAVKAGISGLKSYNLWNLPESFIASLIDRECLQDMFASINPLSNISYTPFEQAMILSVKEANKCANIDLASPNVLFVVSTTKGNVHLLDENKKYFDKKHLYLWYSANLVAQFFDNPNTPIVISNACISGGCAQITAQRMLQSGKYDYAVVVGADLLCRFIVSGFQSFKALSPIPCKPFDKERCGLNLGEAAVTLIMSNEQLTMNNNIRLVSGAICNDANHISAPSRTGEGSFIALKSVLQNIDIENIAFINAHGTATPYNDDMETVAIERSGLANIPVNSLKGCFGHTLGAAGILESIVSMQALREGIVLKSIGFEQNEQLTIDVCRENRLTDKNYFIKMMSGFGGTNAVLLFENAANQKNIENYFDKLTLTNTLYIADHCKITGSLTDLFRSLKINYPKFFKMDNLSKVGFLAAEILLKNNENKSKTAIICFTSAASLNTDTAYQKTIQDKDNFFPSPSLFVYTLPNIVTGEIAIRHNCKTETTCYVSEKADEKMIFDIVNQTFNNTPNLQQVLVGWIDDDQYSEATMMLVTTKGDKLFTEENIKKSLLSD